jgi:hypothetical protein
VILLAGPAIVTAASKRDRAIRRREEVDDGQEASPKIKAFLQLPDAEAYQAGVPRTSNGTSADPHSDARDGGSRRPSSHP